MAALVLEFEEIDDVEVNAEKDGLPVGRRSMYAIVFDLDTSKLEQEYPTPSWQNAYADIRKTLIPLGFTWQQGSVYFGDMGVMDAVKCVLAAQTLSKQYPWFKSCVRDIRMLRIEELNDLGPAL